MTSIFTADASTQGTGGFTNTKTYNTKDNPNMRLFSKSGIYNSADNEIKIFTNNTDALTINSSQQVICNGSLITNIAWGNIDGKPSFFDGTWTSLSGKPTNFQSDWLTTITNKPSLFDGTWTSLSGKPTLFDGTWTSLSGKPTNFQSDWLTTITNKPTLFDGTWTSLSGKPTLFDGTWTSLSGKPTLFDGTWTSLSGKPTNFQSDWNTTITNKPTLFDGTWTSLSGKPTLATVATSGLYNDLSGKPTLFDGTWTSLSGKPDALVNISNIFPTSNVIQNATNLISFNNLTNKPTYYQADWNTTVMNKPAFFSYINNYDYLVNTPFSNYGIDIFTNNQGNTTIGNVSSISTVNGTIYQVINDNNSNYCVFLQSGSITFPQNMVCDIFMIGGGGEGGTNCGGGGGAGSAIIAINQSIPAGIYTITIGAGGAGAVGAAATGNTGGDTSIGSLFVAKGGGGGGGNGAISNTGGCSGGVGGNNSSTAPNPVNNNVVNGVSNISPSITSTYAVLGNKGGNGVIWSSGNYYTIKGAGGGGIGVAGTNATTSAPGIGGDGIYQVIIGGTTYNLKSYFSPNSSFGVNDGSGNFYIGGGGGAAGFGSGINISGGKGGGGIGRDDGNPTAGTNGTVNTGSGGGGGGANTYSNNGGDGGSGVVIIRYKIPNLIVKNNLIVNSNVGIGSTIPAYKLDVAGDVNITGNYKVNGVNLTTTQWTTSGTNIYNNNTGYVGIGNTAPIYNLQVGNNTTTGIIGGTTIHLANGYLDSGLYGVRLYGYDNGTNGHNLAIQTRNTASGTFNNSLIVNSSGNVGINVSAPNSYGKLQVNGVVNFHGGNPNAVPNNFMTAGSLTIGDTTTDYGGTNGWTANTAGLMMECLNNTEIVIHDFNNFLISFMYYYSATKSISYGREKGWGYPNAHYFFCNDKFECYFANAVASWNYLSITPTSLWGDGLSTASDQAGTKYLTIRNIMFQNPHIVPQSVGGTASIRFGRAGGISTGTWYEIGTYADGTFRITKEANTGTGIKIYNSGNDMTIGTTIGIGVDASYRLHVAAGSAGSGTTNFRYFNAGTAISYASTYFTDVCAYFGSTIFSSSWIASSSDTRIKKEIEDINDDTALQMVLAIQPKTYKYIDDIRKGDKKVYGFIAQQIKEVIPEAVATDNKEVIPNIYKLYDVSGDTITTDDDLTTKLNVGDKIEYLLEKSENKEYCKVLEISSTQIKIDKTIGENDNKIFIFGKEIDDFHTISKEYIFTLNVCATQELHRIIKSQEQRISDLEAKLNQLLERLN